MCMRVILFSPVACLNNDKSVMSLPYAWPVLGILPILKASACTNTDETWQMVWYGMRALNSSSLLYIVPDRRQGAQRLARRGFPGLFQHV